MMDAIHTYGRLILELQSSSSNLLQTVNGRKRLGRQGHVGANFCHEPGDPAISDFEIVILPGYMHAPCEKYIFGNRARL